MPLLKRKRVIAAAVETTIGTAETLAGSDAAFNAYDVMIQPNVEFEQRPGQSSFDQLAGVVGPYSGTATFKTDLGWDGAATLPTWASVLLPACGWVDTSNTFNPTSEAPGSNVKTLTIGAYIDGVRKLLAGCMGTFQLVCPTGKMAYIEWTFQGVWQTATDVSLLSPTYPTASPLRYSSATTTYDSVALCVENVTFDAGNNVIMRPCAGTAAGFVSALVTDRAPTITADPEATLVATQDRYGDLLSNAEAEFTVTLDGPSTSTIEIVAAKAQYTNVQEADRNGMVTDALTFQCNKNGTTADQSLQIVFTPTA